MVNPLHPLSLALVLGLVTNVYAEENFPQPRSFTIDQACSAYSSLKKPTNPTALTTHSSYPALGVNKQPDATHTLLSLGGDRKWVSLSCGHFADNQPLAGSTTSTNSQPNNRNTESSADTGCLPFFDNIDNPVKLKDGRPADITPPIPELNAFDKAVDQVCGPAGKSVKPEEFKALFKQHPEVLQRIKTFTQGKVFANRPIPSSDDAYLGQLTEAWFAIKAFDHIFCGQPDAGGPIGGLHFIGRYVQLQQTGEACRMANYRQNEVVPGVLYSMGATMKTQNGGIARSSIKGYGLTLNAEDLLKAATKAFSENPTDSTQTTACILPVKDDGKAFTAVFARRVNGIRTMYPDATPSATDPACQSEVRLN